MEYRGTYEKLSHYRWCLVDIVAGRSCVEIEMPWVDKRISLQSEEWSRGGEEEMGASGEWL